MQSHDVPAASMAAKTIPVTVSTMLPKSLTAVLTVTYSATVGYAAPAVPYLGQWVAGGATMQAHAL